MKYTILGFQQQKLIDNELTLEDALLLRTIKDMYASNRMESIVQENERYIWINQSYLLEQIPILGSISKLKRMLNKLCDSGFLENILITNKKGIAGRFSFIKYTEKLDRLEDYDTKVQNDIWLDGKEDTKVQNDTRPKFKMTLDQSSKRPNKDTSIKDTSIKDTSIYIPYQEIVEYLNSKAETRYKYTSKATQEKIKARWNEKYVLDDFKTVIDNKVADWKGKFDKEGKPLENYLRPETLFGPKFEGYLNQKGGNSYGKVRSISNDTTEGDKPANELIF